MATDTSTKHAYKPQAGRADKHASNVPTQDIYLGGNEMSPAETRKGATDQHQHDLDKQNSPFQFEPQILARRTQVT